MKNLDSTIEGIKNLPYFSSTDVDVNFSNNVLSIALNESTKFLVLLTPEDLDTDDCPDAFMTIYNSEDGIIVMDRVEKKIKIGNPDPLNPLGRDLDTYNKDVHTLTRTRIPYDVITVIHAINEIVDFDLQNQ